VLVNATYKEIKRDPQIWKFCFYGLLKNLKFFEPYLLIYLISFGIGFFEIGLLYGIREGVTYIFEIPSGVIADTYGKKRELMICFLFYMISFVFLFIGGDFYILAIGMFFFGLGEAFRSGTHKAMILTYLERQNWYMHKTFVYGRTRSFSLLGSSISAFLSILLVLNLPAMRWLFLICTVPYIADFILIYTYPDYLDERREHKFELMAFIREVGLKVFTLKGRGRLIKIVTNTALFEAVFKTLKDYIQPILALIILSQINGGGNALSKTFDNDEILKITLGIVYGVYYICSSGASRNVHKLTRKWTSRQLMNQSFYLMSVCLLFLAAGVKMQWSIMIVGVYFVLYLMKDGRKPLFVDLCSEAMEKNERATVFSIESQLRALFTIVAAPTLGWVADKFSISVMLVVAGVVMVVAGRFIKIEKEFKL